MKTGVNNTLNKVDDESVFILSSPLMKHHHNKIT